MMQLTKYAPLLQLAGKKAAELSSEDIRSFANILSLDEEGSNLLTSLFEEIAKVEPDISAISMLGSKTAKNVLTNLSSGIENDIIVTCPFCSGNFEI